VKLTSGRQQRQHAMTRSLRPPRKRDNEPWRKITVCALGNDGGANANWFPDERAGSHLEDIGLDLDKVFGQRVRHVEDVVHHGSRPDRRRQRREVHASRASE
jgi:hypothetical protein